MECAKTMDVNQCDEIKKHLYDPLSERDEDLCKRCHEEQSPSRPEYQRDYTRVMYSSAFRRLQGKMQLLGINNSNFTRNRLTHSLEVAQIARSIADDIGYSQEDTYVVETCALAHDIGNPPFGHHGENVLDSIIKENIDSEEMEGFEGNAQTLRVLTTLQAKYADFQGMNLTYRTLLGVTKYFFPYHKKVKGKYIYKDDYEMLSNYLSKIGASQQRTLDVQIMDIADEIAYAAHDLEDTLRMRLFTPDEFLIEFKNNDKYETTTLDNAAKQIKDYFDNAKEIAEKDSQHFHSLFCKQVGSTIIHKLIADIGLVEKDGQPQLGFVNHAVVADGLKKVTFDCVNKFNDIKFYELKGEIILRGLFEFFNKHPNYLPSDYQKTRNLEDEIVRIRSVVDYISGMMDMYAIDLYEQIYGKAHFDAFGYSSK